MADKAGFDEKRRLTNHSARKNYDTKTEPQQHSTNSYNAIIWSQKRPKRPPITVPSQTNNRKNMSLILSGNTTSTSIEERPVSSSRSGVASECCESSFMKSSSFPAAGPFSRAVFHGGQFNITINNVNKSPTSTDRSTHSTQSFKRIKRVFESSDEDSPTTVTN